MATTSALGSTRTSALTRSRETRTSAASARCVPCPGLHSPWGQGLIHDAGLEALRGRVLDMPHRVHLAVPCGSRRRAQVARERRDRVHRGVHRRPASHRRAARPEGSVQACTGGRDQGCVSCSHCNRSRRPLTTTRASGRLHWHFCTVRGARGT